jgi:mRNA interferase HicA
MSDTVEVKGREFVKKLKRIGVTIIEGRGKGGHVLAIHGDKQTTIPTHGAKDISPEFLKALCKQLGVNPRDVL